jgi:hypothetical protein
MQRLYDRFHVCLVTPTRTLDHSFSLIFDVSELTWYEYNELRDTNVS